MIELRHINRYYQVGEQVVKALDDLSLTIRAGEYVSIMGPSGSGKSTLLNIIGLLDRPTSGDYLLSDKNVTTLSDIEQAQVRNQDIGFVFQMFHLITRLTAAENIELPLILAGIEPDERRHRVSKSLEALGIADRGHHKPEQLSGGQRQRVAIARATISQTKVILADEPTGNLDQNSGADVIQILERLVDKGITLIMVTHDPDMGRRARRQLHMIDGKLTGDRRDDHHGHA